jgi:excisionase family DNA binding protein
VAEAAIMLRVSQATIVRAIKDGKLPSFTLARRLLIPKDALASAFRVKDPS